MGVPLGLQRQRFTTLRQVYGAIFGECEAGIPGDLPQVTIEVAEIAGIAAPNCFGGQLDHFGAGRPRFGQDVVHFLPGARVVCDGEPFKTVAVSRNAGVSGEFGSWIEGEGHTAALEERDAFVGPGLPPAEAFEE